MVLTVPAGTTFIEALATAGGPTDRARLEDVRLIRGSHVQAFDIAKVGSADARTVLQSGDQIFVDRSVSFFRDYLAPLSSVVGAAAAIVSIVVTLRR
jgi:protein involved in polysaccharide export with SLBB domain